MLADGEGGAVITGTAIDTGYTIGSNSITLVWIENLGDFPAIFTETAFGTNQNIAGIYLDVTLDDANTLGVDVFMSQVAGPSYTLLITVFDQDENVIDNFSRLDASSRPRRSGGGSGWC